MKKIILASKSHQRKKLLRQFGVKFSVIPSSAPEKKRISSNCAVFVKHNALLKAKDVAAKLKKGIIIGADSIVYLGQKRIIGKPKNKREAKKILKILFSQPHWVYTGVAIVDAASGKQIVNYEKTKVFMITLNDEEIDRYHQKVAHRDKAGGFDIEGWGGLFIRRIEGSYTNVIGLPMAKLSLMLKHFGITIL